jgi:Lar family restriction alleviation protein
MSELLTCPFCDSPAAICELEDEPGSPASFWVNCSCGIETPERRTEPEAIALWNRRAPCEAMQAALEPFAKLADLAVEGHRDSRPIIHGFAVSIAERLTIGHLRAARAALSKAKGQSNG